MDDAKRRAMIKAQVAKKKEFDDVDPKGTGSSNSSIKRKLLSKGDRPPKKPKVPLEPVVGLMAESVKMITPVKHGDGKGFMKAPSTDQEKLPVLLRKDSKHVLEQILSIMTFCRHSSNHTRQPSVHPFPLAFYLTPFLHFRPWL